MDIFSLSISEPFVAMLIRLFVCIVVNLVIVDRLYYKKSRRRDFYFTFMLISLAVFFMIFVLEDMKAKTSIGIGIGLFGIFSIMRYRTDAMPVREMTYLFVIISLSVVNAIAASVSIVELLVTNIIVVDAIWLCEHRLKLEPSKLVQYDRLELIKPDRSEDLKADLEMRLGLKVRKVEVGAIDMLRDMAVLRVYYDANTVSNTVDEKMKLNRADLVEV